MEKPIIVTNLDGLLIKHKAFFEPHKDWFDRAIKKTEDKSLEIWKGKEDYFLGVNLAMEKIMPNSTSEERTTEARKWYQEDVIKYIKKNPSVIRRNIAKKLIKLKEKYTLVLLTTNAEYYIDRMLENSKLKNIYDGIISSKTEKEPNKEDLIKKLLRKYGKPDYYLSGKEDIKTNNIFKTLGTKIIKEKDLNNL